MIKIYNEIFGPNFQNNIAFVFTRWSMSKKAIKNRSLNNDTEEKRTTEYNN